MEYLDPHQIARLECLKLAMADRTRPPAEALASAYIMARFVIDGIKPADEAA